MSNGSSKRLLAGGIVRDLWFANQADYDAYLGALSAALKPYVVLNRVNGDHGYIIVRILQQYINSNLIELSGDLSEIYHESGLPVRDIEKYMRFMDLFRAAYPDLFACLRSAFCDEEVPGDA